MTYALCNDQITDQAWRASIVRTVGPVSPQCRRRRAVTKLQGISGSAAHLDRSALPVHDPVLLDILASVGQYRVRADVAVCRAVVKADTGSAPGQMQRSKHA